MTAVPNRYRGRMSELGKYEVRRFRDLSPFLPRVSPELHWYFLANRKKFDVVINNGYQIPLSLEIGIHPHPNLIFRSHFHGIVGHTAAMSVLHRFYKPFGRIMVNHSRVIVCGSEYEAKAFAEAFPEAAKKIRVIREGVQPIECHAGTRRVHRVLTISRLERYKGVQHVIRSLRYLPEYRLDIVGEGPFKKELIHLAKEAGVTDRITFHGFVEEAARNRLFCLASVFVLLSEQEAYGIVVGQSLTAGVPCVVLNKNALSEWIDNRSCYGVNDQTDYQGLAEKIRTAEQVKPSARVPTWGDYMREFSRLVSR